MSSLKYKRATEEWLIQRREYSEYSDCIVTKEIQEKVKNTTGLSDEILDCEENTNMQLWIDNITDKLIKSYVTTHEDIRRKDDISTILLLIGFKKEYLQQFDVLLLSELQGHMMLDEIIEILLESILYKYI